MNLKNALIFTILTISFFSCSSEDKIEVSELPDRFWAVQLNGEDFTIPNTGQLAYYDAFDGDFTVAGTKSFSTDERIVLTFSVENGAPFVDGQSLDLGEDSGNSCLYFDGKGNSYSTHFLDGNGSFKVDQYIETETRNFLSGTVDGILFNEVDSTEISVTGSFAVLTF